MDWKVRNFDTLGSFEQLKEVGVAEAQARVFVQMVAASLDASVANLPTKADLKETETGLRAEIQEVRAELKAEIQAVRAEFKADIQEVRAEIQAVRTELKADIAELKSELNQRISGLEASMILMQRLFFGGTLTILFSIGALFLHH